MEIRQSAGGFSGRAIAAALAIVAVLAIVVVGWQLVAAGRPAAATPSSAPVTSSNHAPVTTSGGAGGYVEPDARDRASAAGAPGVETTKPVTTHGSLP